MSEPNEENQQSDETALAISRKDEAAFDSPQAFIPSAREQAELASHLTDLRQTLEEGIGGTTKPTDLADSGVTFDIVDAYLTTMVEDGGEERTKIVFHVVEQDTGIDHKVMQSLDKRGIRQKYAELFSMSKAVGQPQPPLVGYQFVYGTKVIAGNKAVILQRAPRALSSAV